MVVVSVLTVVDVLSRHSSQEFLSVEGAHEAGVRSPSVLDTQLDILRSEKVFTGIWRELNIFLGLWKTGAYVVH